MADTTTTPVSRVGIVGGGIMGAGIAEVCAKADLDVVLIERDEPSTEAARGRVEGSIRRVVSRGKLDEDTAKRAIESITFASEMPLLADRELVIEAVVERKETKTDVFRQLAEVVE